jgi:hypothetical protein
VGLPIHFSFVCLFVLIQGLLLSLEFCPTSISCGESIFHGTNIEIWAGYGLVDNTEKKRFGPNEQILRTVFSCFHGQKKIFKKKYIVASALKSCIK